ncbi:MAG: hypothetical protein IKO85_00585 [Bacteroidaceae bacterium]|jgi:hypothetical protein|nr:hypothetical protein [Prevotella sp.]MBR4533033.1 hypothetical protein [Bacteroidaceae bacterium]
MEKKTVKTPLMMALAFGQSSSSSGLTPKSKLLRNPEAQYGFVPTLGALRRLTLQEHSHHGGKNTVTLRSTEKRLRIVRNRFFSPKGGVFASEDV